MRLADKLEKLKNKQWMYNTRIQKVLQTRVNEDSIEIVTDLNWYTFPIGKAEAALEEFLPVEQKGLVKVSTDLPVQELSLSLSKVIAKLDVDEEIPAAELKKYDAINKTVQTVINLGKLKLDILKAGNG